MSSNKGFKLLCGSRSLLLQNMHLYSIYAVVYKRTSYLKILERKKVCVVSVSINLLSISISISIYFCRQTVLKLDYLHHGTKLNKMELKLFLAHCIKHDVA